MTSQIASLMFKSCFLGSPFFERSRIRLMISPARFPSFTMSVRISRNSSTSTTSAPRKRKAACAFDVHRLFRPLGLGQIEHDGDTLALTFIEGRCTDQNGHAAAVFPEVLLLDR